MATPHHPPGEELRSILMGLLTLQEWQEQLLRGALEKLDSSSDKDAPAVPIPTVPDPT